MQDENKIGAGIMTICILRIIFAAFIIIGNVLLLTFHDFYKSFYDEIGTKLPSISFSIVLLIISISLIASIALILKKNKIGVIGYVALEAISLIITLLTSKVTIWGLLLDLILPVLMVIFIYQKKDLYFNN